jgi:hypothetical protein
MVVPWAQVVVLMPLARLALVEPEEQLLVV